MTRKQKQAANLGLVCCEKCGSTELELDGWDIDKCRDCGHWRYRVGLDKTTNTQASPLSA